MLGHEPHAAEPMDQPLTTLSAAADQAVSNATDQTSPFGRTRANLRSLGVPRLLMLAATALRLGRVHGHINVEIDRPSDLTEHTFDPADGAVTAVRTNQG
jgi:hypothetical protein